MRYTAARLTAAILLALLAGYISELLKHELPENTQFGWFSYVNMVLGALVGWFIIGRRAGLGYVNAISNGLTGALVLAFWALFAQAGNEMLRLALLRRYDGPLEAITAVFQTMIDFSVHLLDVQVLATLLIGGIVVAALTESASRRWT